MIEDYELVATMKIWFIVAILIALAISGILLTCHIAIREQWFENKRFIGVIGLVGGFAGIICTIATLSGATFNPVYAVMASVGVVTSLAVWMHIRGMWESIYKICGV